MFGIELTKAEAGSGRSQIVYVNICRICLEPGEIPIFGDDDKPDVSAEVKAFSNIDITYANEYPQHLCTLCHKLLQSAILFRKKAQESEIIIQSNKNKIEEKFLHFDEDIGYEVSDGDNDMSDYCQETGNIKLAEDTDSDNNTNQGFERNINESNDSKTIKDLKNEFHVITEADVKPESKKIFVCDKCGKVFSKSSSFKLHCGTHGGELKFQCMICPYRGLHKGLLRIHVRTHTGDYNYKCEKCPARFITKSNLNKHLRTHLGPINFKCEICNRGFYTKLSLKRHNEVDHLGIKNHFCNICGKAFGYRDNMMNHQLKVHKREKLTDGKGRVPSYLLNKSNENK